MPKDIYTREGELTANSTGLTRDPLELLNTLISEASYHLETMKVELESLKGDLHDLEFHQEGDPASRTAWLSTRQALLKDQIELYRGAVKQTSDLVAISLRHGLDARLVKVEEDKVTAVTSALNRALSAIGISGDMRTTAERVLAQELAAEAGNYQMLGD